MTRSLHTRPFRPFARFARAFSRRTEGVAAVEFALIVPIMATLFIGAVELSQAITANRHMTQVASSVGDLVARSSTGTINDTDIVDIMNVGSYLMLPYTASTLKATISLVGSSASSATTTINEWKCAYDGSNPGSVTCSCPYSAVVIPPNLVTTSDFVMITTVTYGYKPPLFDVFMKTGYGGEVGGVYTMTDTVYLKPRASPPQLSIGGGTPCVLK